MRDHPPKDAFGRLFPSEQNLKAREPPGYTNFKLWYTRRKTYSENFTSAHSAKLHACKCLEIVPSREKNRSRGFPSRSYCYSMSRTHWRCCKVAVRMIANFRLEILKIFLREPVDTWIISCWVRMELNVNGTFLPEEVLSHFPFHLYRGAYSIDMTRVCVLKNHALMTSVRSWALLWLCQKQKKRKEKKQKFHWNSQQNIVRLYCQCHMSACITKKSGADLSSASRCAMNSHRSIMYQ